MTSHENNSRAQSPLRGVLLCCTAIPPEERSRMAAVVQQMGGTHMLDLTSDVTHLIVGDIDTPKYKYVARERPDIKVLRREWLDAVRNIWLEGGDADVVALEEEYKLPTFAGLRICLTGFETDEQRRSISETVTSNGARYDADLSKRVSHLVAMAPRGKKYDHAVLWGIKVVSPEWINDSLARSMTLDEAYYNPLLPEEERGKGAVLRKVEALPSLGKRPRGDDTTTDTLDAGRRKLRRTTSAKLGSQSDGIWADIGSEEARPPAARESEWSEPFKAATKQQTDKRSSQETDLSNSGEPKKNAQHGNQGTGIFQGRTVTVRAFDTRKNSILKEHLEANGALVLPKDSIVPLEGAADVIHIVPHSYSPRDLAGLKSTEQGLEKGTIVTEWWVERCLHYKRAVDPTNDILSRPLPAFPISGFSEDVICPTSFTGVDLLHFSKLVKLLGAKYDEYLNPSTTILVCNSKSPNLEKVKYALQHGIAVVFVDWIWDCLERAARQPFGRFQIAAPSASSMQKASSEGTAVGQTEHASPARERGEDSTRSAASHGPDVRRPGRSGRLELSFTRRPPQRVSVSHDSKRSISQPLKLSNLSTTREQLKKHRSFVDAEHSRFSSPLEDIAPEVNSPERRSQSSAALAQGHAGGSESRLKGAKHTPHELPRADGQSSAVEVAPSSDPLKTANALTEDIAHLLARNKASAAVSNINEKNALRRHRTLGRAASNPSSLSAIPRQQDAVVSESYESAPADLNPIDDLSPAKRIEDIMPSQMLSYEEADAPAVRESLMKRMGIDGSLNVMQGMQRVESIGLVKDVEGGVAERVGNRRRNARRK